MNLGLKAIELSFDMLNDKVLGFGDIYIYTYKCEMSTVVTERKENAM